MAQEDSLQSKNSGHTIEQERAAHLPQSKNSGHTIEQERAAHLPQSKNNGHTIEQEDIPQSKSSRDRVLQFASVHS